jgi:glycosyltransferase involved in cell wall biosynthesis
MKILYLITRSERGGAQVNVLDLLVSLPRGCTAVLGTGELGFLSVEATKLGIPVRIIPDLIQPIHLLKDLKAMLGILRLIRDESPDIIHAHTSKAGLLGRVAAFLMGIPIVFTAHTWSFVGGVSRGQRWYSVPLERLAGALGGMTIAVSQANLDLALQLKVTPRKRLVRIWNGVVDVPVRASAGTRESVTLIMTARFVKQKDHVLLLEALAGVTGNWRLLLVGDGPDLPEVRASAAKLKINDRVDFLGDRDDVPRLLAEADIFVLATNWEGLPLSILEAMRAGLPVIATNVGGVPEAVTDGVTGYLTQRGSVVQMRTRLQALIDSRDLLVSMGNQGRHRYEQDFRVEAMVQETVAVYRLALAKRRPVAVES